jgi:hypothetical protein
MDNLLAAIALCAGGAILPLASIYLKTAMYTRQQDEQIESGMTSVTTAYLQSGDLIAAVESALAQIPSPLDNVFKLFLVDARLLDANIPNAIRKLRNRLQNRHWQDWCDILLQCHWDRQLRETLPGVIGRLGETRRVQMALDTKLKQQFHSYTLTVLIVLSSIPMMAAIMPDWYDMLMHTVPGKITLGIVLFAMLGTLLWVVRVFRPIDAPGRPKNRSR